ncbi:MAG: tetratricopeptide repeat protein, partial [Gemmatimonadetes bacterium]|nr:tetratricopeptide repeat protein [Gemmatimonadota bacterium]
AEADGRTSLVPGVVEAEYHTDEYRDMFEVAAEQLAERATGRDLSAAEINAYWMARARAWMAENPADAVRLLGKKALLFWTGLENSNNRDFADQAERFTPILRVFLWQLTFLMPFALLGLLFFRGRRAESGLIVSFIVVFWVAIAAFFVCSRFRQPAVALLLPYAAAGMVGALDSVRGRARPAGMILGVLAGLFVVTNHNLLDRIGVLDLSVPNAPFHRYNLAVMLDEEGDLEGAVREYRAAAATHPDDPRIDLNLGNALIKLGRVEEAVPHLDRAAAAIPSQAVSVNWNLGILALQAGRWDEAARRLGEVRRLQPQHPEAALARGTALLEGGRLEEASRELMAASQARPQDPRVLQALVLLATRQGDPERAAMLQAQLDGMGGR